VAVIAVLTNLPDSDSAFNLARALVRSRLAACASVLAPATSFYRWEGREEQASEYPVLIKSTQERYIELQEAILKLHPYSVPEIISWPVGPGLPAYLSWVEQESQSEAAPGAAP
jgi:periplasmic divalent cation tolerance protein